MIDIDEERAVADAVKNARALVAEQRAIAAADEKRRADQRAADEQRAAADAKDRKKFDRVASWFFGPPKEPPKLTPREVAIARYNDAIKNLDLPGVDRDRAQAEMQAAIDECVRVGVMQPRVDLPTELEQLAAQAGEGASVALPGPTLVRLAAELRALRLPLPIRH